MAAFHEGKLVVVYDNICIFLCDLHGSFVEFLAVAAKMFLMKVNLNI